MPSQIIPSPSLEKKAKISLVLGIISSSLVILIALFAEIIARYFPEAAVGFYPISPLLAFVFFAASLIGVVGFFFGFLSLKSTKRIFAIAGIVLCTIGLLVPLYYFIFG